MIKAKLALISILSLVVVSIHAQSRVVSYDKSKGIDFTKYKSFGFLDIDIENEEEFKNYELAIKRLETAISNELTSRGLNNNETDPDLWINIGITKEEVTQTRETDWRDAQRYMGQRNYSWQSEEVVVREYEEGTVSLDFVDRQTNEMVWQGVAAGTIQDNPKKADKTVNKAMAKLFKKFPIQ